MPTSNKSQQDFDSYIVNDNSKINFGKFKGKPHSVLLDPNNTQYCIWIMSLEDFAIPTQRYIKEHLNVIV